MKASGVNDSRGAFRQGWMGIRKRERGERWRGALWGNPQAGHTGVKVRPEGGTGSRSDGGGEPKGVPEEGGTSSSGVQENEGTSASGVQEKGGMP